MDNYRFLADRPVEQYHKSDFWFIAFVILLLGLGLFTQYFCTQSYAERMFNDSFYFVKRQFASAVVGFIGFMLFGSLRIDVIRKILPYIFYITVFLCLLTFIPVFSVEKNGARRWLKMPFSFTLQSSELVKFTLVLFLSNLFDKQLLRSEEERTVLPCVLGLLFFMLLVVLQKDLSTTIFIFIVCFSMFYAAGLKIRWVGVLLLLSIPLLILFITSEPYRLERIIAFIKPEEGAHTYNYQTIAAKHAISSGSFWGRGIGVGLTKSIRIPELQADYIFAGWTEAMGFFGVILYFLLLGVFCWRGYRIAFVCKNRFASYGAFGYTTMLVLQSLVNLAVVCGGVPSTGIPLPFFSVGGSSIIVSLCMCGFIVNSSRYDSDSDKALEEEFESSNLYVGGLYE